jgi:tetratricopeptide (TPR) repeat protein
VQLSKLLSLPCGFAAFAIVLITSAGSAAAPEAAAVAASVPVNPMTKFYGHAAVESSCFEQHLQSGLEALEQRIYGQAELQLTAASAELRQHNITDGRWLRTRLALGQAFLGEEKLEAAERVLSDVAAHARGQDSQIYESALTALAETWRLLGDQKRAQTLCEQAIADARQAHGTSPRELARVYATQAEIMAAQGLDKAAIDLYRQALKLAQSDPDDRYDAAEITYKLAVQLHNTGQDASQLFDRAFAQLDREANLTCHCMRHHA